MWYRIKNARSQFIQVSSKTNKLFVRRLERASTYTTKQPD